MIGNSYDETNFPHKLFLTLRQVAYLHIIHYWELFCFEWCIKDNVIILPKMWRKYKNIKIHWFQKLQMEEQQYYQNVYVTLKNQDLLKKKRQKNY